MSSTNHREVLHETLSALLSPEAATRNSAEQQMLMLQVLDDHGLDLLFLALSPSVTFAVRQMSLVLLKRYIDSHWSKTSEKFTDPEVAPNVKLALRTSLLTAMTSNATLSSSVAAPALSDSQTRKLLSSLSYCVAGIASFDWPEDWSDLLPALMSMLQVEGHAMYSAMKVLVDVCQEVSDAQISSIAPALFPKLLQIITSRDIFSVKSRSRALAIFASLSETISAMAEYDKTAFKKYLEPFLQHFVEGMVAVMGEPGNQGHEDVAIKKEAVNALTVLLKNCRKQLLPWLSQILTHVWNLLTSSAEVYVATEVYGDSSANGDDVDSDGDLLKLDTLLFSLFDFVTIVVETKKSRKMIRPQLSDLIYYVIIYGAITEDQVYAWAENPDQFVEDEDDDSYSYSIRTCALDLILSLAQEFEENESAASYANFKLALLAAIKKHMNDASTSTNVNAWKMQEACLLTLGSIAPSLVTEATRDNQSQLGNDIRLMLEAMMTTCGQEGSSPFLRGRLLWTMARFVPMMPPQSIERLLNTAVASLVDQSCSPVMKISAVRAIFTLVDHLKSKGQTHLVAPFLPAMAEGLIGMGTAYSTQVLALVLETLTLVISVDYQLAASVEPRLTPLVIATFLKLASDPVLISICCDLLSELCKCGANASLESRVIPVFVSFLVPAQQTQSVAQLQPVAIDLLTTIVLNSPQPLSPLLINSALPAAVTAILSTCDDHATLQNGGECLRAFVSKGSEQLANYRDESSSASGIELAFRVSLHLLDPRIAESCSTFVGRLVTSLISRAGGFLGSDNIHLLLRSCLSKLTNCESLSLMQSLIVVFAQLMNHQLSTVIEFLSSLPSPTTASGQNGSSPKSALEFVLTQWLTRQHLFFGARDKRICICALAKLMEWSVSSGKNDDALNLNLMRVPGDAIEEPCAGIRTRSKSKASASQQQWTMVPATVKILKILVAEIEALREEKETRCFESDEDDDDDEGSSEDSGRLDLSHLCDEADLEEDQDEDEDDEDPLNGVDLICHLTEFMRSFKCSPFANQFVDHLTDNEKILLESI